MDQLTRENFPYEDIANSLGYDTEGGINDAQRDMLYNDSVKRHLDDKVKEFTGKDQKMRAIEDTLNQYGNDARNTLGIPEEVEDSGEPFAAESVLNYYNSIDPQFRNLKVSEFVDDYSGQFYGEMQPLQRKFLNNISEKSFKSELKRQYEGKVNFEDDTVAELITKLTPPTPEQIQATELEQQQIQTDNEPGVIGKLAINIKDAIVNTPKSLYNSLVDTASGGLRLVDSAADFVTDYGDEVVYDPENREFILDAGSGKDKVIKDIDGFNNPEPGALWKLADVMQEGLTLDIDTDTFGGEVGQGLGQVASLLGGAGLVKFISGSVTKGSGISAAMGITQGGESGYKDYIQSIQENGDEFNEDTAQASVGLNALIGASDFIPALYTMRKITGDGAVPAGALLKRIDEGTGGLISRNFAKLNKSKTRRGAFVVEGAKGAAVEGTQELVQGIAADAVASNILKYDEDREIFVSDETVGGSQVGSVVGMLLNGVIGAMTKKRRKAVINSITDDPNSEPTEDLSDEPLVGQTTQQVDLDTGEFTTSPITDSPAPPDDTVDGLNTSVGPQVPQETLDDAQSILTSSENLSSAVSVDDVLSVMRLSDGQTVTQESINEAAAILESSDKRRQTEEDLTAADLSVGETVSQETIDQVVNILGELENPYGASAIQDVVGLLELSIGEPITQETLDGVSGALGSSTGETTSQQSIDDATAILESSIGRDSVLNQQPNPTTDTGITEVELGEGDFVSDPIVESRNGSFTATDSIGTQSVAVTPNQAEADARIKRSLLPNNVMASINNEAVAENDRTIATENLQGGGQRTTLTTPFGELTITAADSEAILDTFLSEVLVDENVPNLPDGLVINQTESGYELELLGVKVRNPDLLAGLNDINNIVASNVGPTDQRSSTKVQLEEPKDPNIISLTGDGFSVEQTIPELEANGYVLLNHYNPNVKGPVSKTGFVAYKDGFIYTVKTKSSGRGSRVATVDIKDLDGNKYNQNRNESTQEYLVNSVLQNPVNESALDRVIQTTPSDNPGVVLRQPNRGIKVKQGNVSNDDGSAPVTVLDSESVDDIAQRLGGISRQIDSRTAQVITTDSITSIAVTPDGEVFIDSGGQGKQLFQGPFNVTDTGSRTESNMSLMTRELESIQYKLTDVTPNKITLKNESGSVVTLNRSDKGELSVETNGRDFLVNDMGVFRSLFSLPDKGVDLVTNRNDDAEPISHDMNSVRQRTVKKLFDLSDQMNSVQTINNKPTFANSQDVSVILDGPESDTEGMLERLRINASVPTDAELQNEAKIDWNRSDLDDPLSLIPAHIRNKIDIHTNSVNPASEIGAWGFFAPSDQSTARPHIHIDAGPFRSYESVIGTISEEVAHFSLDSWGMPQLDGLVDRMFNLVKDDAIRELPEYIAQYDIDINNMSLSDKWVLTNEFFSKQGTSFVDFDANNIPTLPPGVTREEMRALKKDVENTVQNVIIDLRKDSDYKGTKEDADKFIRDILRLQAGSVLSEGVVVTYKINQPDGKPAEIIVRSTPFGSERQTIPNTRNAKRVARLRQWLAASSGRSKSIKRFIVANIYGTVDTPIGRENSIILNGVYNPASTADATMLKNVNLMRRRVERILDGLGLGPLPIEGNHYQTFVRHGITSKKSLKLAKEIDQFMRIGFDKSNENIAKIRGAFRMSKRIINQMVVNHPGANVNLPKWNREIDNSINRFSTDVDHIQYKAYQPGGDKELIQMRDALRHGSQFADDVSAAQGRIAEINSRTDLSKKQKDVGKDEELNKLRENIRRDSQFTKDISAAQSRIDAINARTDLSQNQKDNKKYDDERLVSTNERLMALEQWAADEVVLTGQGNVQGIMTTQLDKIIDANQDYHTQSEGVGDFISALKSRKLDENIAHDRDFMTFLGRITDPVQIMLGTLEQQNKILNNIQHTNNLAVGLERDSIATPIGSTVTETLFSEGDKSVLSSANGGVLNYLQVDPEMAVFIRKDQEISKALHQNVVGSGAVGQAITTIKANQTVLSLKLALSNFYSNISVLIAGGHLAYLGKYKQAGTTIKAGWGQHAVFGQSLLKDGETVGDMIANEMAELNVFQGGTATLDAQMTNGTVIGKTMDAIGEKFAESRGFTDGVNKFMELTRKFYSFGDEYSKVLPYLVNRDIGIAQAKNEINRVDFTPGKLGEVAYERAITEMGTRIAADRTGRETNNWIIAPQIARETVKNKVRFIMGDYILHPFQVVRIMVENKRMIAEDVIEYKKAIRDGNTKYAAIMKKAAATRAIGNVITDTTYATLLAGGLTPLGYLLATVFDGLEPDDEDTPMADRQSMTIAEIDAFYRASNSINSGWGGAAYYPISRDGYKVTYYDGKRLSAMNTLIPTKSATTDSTATDYIKGFAGNFMNIGRESIALRVLNTAYYNKDSYGRTITEDEVVSEIGKMFLPGSIKQIYDLNASVADVMQDPTSPDGPDREQSVIEKAATLGGVKVKTHDLRDEVVNLGYRATRHLNSQHNATLRSLKKRLGSGDEFEQHDVAPLLTDMIKSNEEVMANIQYGISAFVDSGLTYDQIEKYMKVKTDGVTGPESSLSKALTRSLVKNENGFHQSVITQLTNQRKEIEKDAKVSNSTSQRDITNKLAALQIAIDEYQKYVDKMRGQ